jgi:uncharacterized protein (DUF2252 family)
VTTTTGDERRAAGRALRADVPRSVHAEWDVEARDRDPIAVLEEQARTRVAELVPVRHERMAASPFAFFRGGAAIMAMDLSTTPVTGLTVQACGDAHVANFGTFATPERNVIFDVNDFDETERGPWEWDVKRLATSLHVVAREHGFTPAQRDDVVLEAVRVYREYVDQYSTMRALDVWYDHTTADDLVAHFPKRYRAQARRDVTRALRKDHVRAVTRLTTDTDGGPRFVEDPPIVVHLDDLEPTADDVAATVADYRTGLSDERRFLLDRFRVVDVARRVVGVGSVGTRCWVALFEATTPVEGTPDRIVLQVKEAPPSVLAPYVGPAASGHEGRRVVAGQRLTQVASDVFLGWCRGPSGHHYYVRQLWDVKGQGDLTRMDLGKLTHYGALCAWTLARAHARTGDAAAITGYLGRGAVFDRAIAEFAAKYAAANERDHAALVDAISSGRVVSNAAANPVANLVANLAENLAENQAE